MSELAHIEHQLAQFLVNAPTVDVGEWHAMDVKGIPHAVTRELIGVRIQIRIPETMHTLQEEVKPNLPWAEAQFQERVGGEPLNPGETYKDWPWQSQMDKHKSGTFSHTYMERFWPKDASWTIPGPMKGIRFNYGDLNDVVDQLERSPKTRQACLPVWFPEDTGATHGERVPCTMYYQFLMREEKLNVIYAIRSVDFIRHFRDDVYMAARLGQWMRAKLDERDSAWSRVSMGYLTVNIGSLHIMAGDMHKLKREYA